MKKIIIQTNQKPDSPNSLTLIRMFERVKAGDSVLLVWADLGSSSDMFQAVVTSVKEAAGEL